MCPHGRFSLAWSQLLNYIIMCGTKMVLTFAVSIYKDVRQPLHLLQLLLLVVHFLLMDYLDLGGQVSATHNGSTRSSLTLNTFLLVEFFSQ